MNFLFLFTVTPVQSFISQARKTRDLKAGSYILSYICKNSIEFIKKLSEAEGVKCSVIFPFIGNAADPAVQSIPNRFIAEIKDCASIEKARIIGDNLELKIKENIKTLANEVFLNNVKGQFEAPADYLDCITGHFQINWLFMPQTADYKTDYNLLESYAGAVKNIRNFGQNPELGRKCSICGERNAVFRGPESKLELKIRAENMYMSNEGLCPVCFLKRCIAIPGFGESMEFPSTAHIALLKSLTRLNKSNPSIAEDYKKSFGGNSSVFDEQLYFDENLNKKYLQKYGFSKAAVNIDIIKKNRKTVIDELKHILGTDSEEIALPKYYSVLVFDGDSIGKLLSGDTLDDMELKIELKDFHCALSERLNAFAAKAKQIIEKEGDEKGKVIYSGGDDFLGLININYLFEVINELKKGFDETVNKALNEKFKTGKINITFTAGIVIANYKESFGFVISKAHEICENAKKISDEKNAIGIGVIKKSGEMLEAYFKSKYKDYTSDVDKDISLLDIVNTLVQKLSEGYYSNTFIYGLQKEMAVFSNNRNKILPKSIGSMLKLEIKRLLIRSAQKDKFKAAYGKDYENKMKADISKMSGDIFNFYNEAMPLGNNQLNNFINCLQASNFISKKVI